MDFGHELVDLPSKTIFCIRSKRGDTMWIPTNDIQRKKGQTHPVPRTVTLIHLSLTYQPKISDPITVLRCAREHMHCTRLLSDNFSSDIPQKRQLNDERNKNTWHSLW